MDRSEKRSSDREGSGLEKLFRNASHSEEATCLSGDCHGLPRADTACADPDFFTVSPRLMNANILNVGEPPSFRPVMGVAYTISGAGNFPANLTLK